MRRRPSSSAFTLFELILVMVIIALISAVAVPALAGFARGRIVSDTAANFVALASYARNHAISEGVVYRLSIDPNNGQVTITHDDGTGQNFVPADDLNAQPLILPAGMKIDTDAPDVDGAKVVEFQPAGRTDPATMRFTDAYGNSVEVACTSPFGFFRIASGPDVPGGHS